MYEDPEVQKQVLSVIPLKELEEKAETKAKENNTAFKDELVKCLLYWYKYDFFSWCNSPKCSNCQNETKYHESQGPTPEESKHLASRVEIHKCNSCNQSTRFPRYNSPAKLSQTKTGRCGEYANLFGCVLRVCGFDVRFIDNFEDHVWNEYWSEALQRVFY